MGLYSVSLSDVPKQRKRSQSKTESEEIPSDKTTKQQQQQHTQQDQSSTKEETEYELEVANEEKEIDYRMLAMSRTGTLRAYKKEREAMNSTQNTRARSNSVVIASHHTLEFISKPRYSVRLGSFFDPLIYSHPHSHSDTLFLMSIVMLMCRTERS
jgi:hypothetical protein